MNQKDMNLPIAQGSITEIIRKKDNSYEVIRSDGKKTIITIPPKENDE